ncbi:MAG TPA: dienelactone hydrolase family protein [Candidatus Binatia bacterium]
MNVETIGYSVSGLACSGRLVHDPASDPRQPLLLVAPNWRGVTADVVERAKELAAGRYVAFVADMFGEGNAPKGTENPLEFLAPLMNDPAETRRRIVAAFDAMSREAERRGIGDVGRRAAIGFCFGGSNVLDLARAGADVQAVVSVHGILATSLPATKGTVKAAVLTLHGADDPISPKAHRDALEAEMNAAGARWYALTFGRAVHSFTDVAANNPPISKYDEPATRHGYALAHGFIADAFAGRLD